MPRNASRCSEVELVKEDIMGTATDPIADFLTIIRNGVRAKKEKITTRGSNITLKIAEILKQEGFIDNCKLVEEGGKRFIRIHLKYFGDKQPAIHIIQRISKPGVRYYAGAKEIPSVIGGLGISILSTPKGIISDREARRANVGGELICKVW